MTTENKITVSEDVYVQRLAVLGDLSDIQAEATKRFYWHVLSYNVTIVDSYDVAQWREKNKEKLRDLAIIAEELRGQLSELDYIIAEREGRIMDDISD